MFQYDNAYYSVFFNIIFKSINRIERGYSIDDIEQSLKKTYSIPSPYYEKDYDDSYDDNLIAEFYYNDFLYNLEDMVNTHYEDCVDTFYV